MNPELVDASLKKKDLKKKSTVYEEPQLIDTFNPLEETQSITSVLKDTRNKELHNPYPSFTSFVGDLGDENVYLLQEFYLPEPDSFYYPTPLPTSLHAETGSSPKSSLEYMDDRDVNRVEELEFPYTVEESLDTCRENIADTYVNVYQVPVEEEVNSFLHQDHPSVIVKNDSANVKQCEYLNMSAGSDYKQFDNFMFRGTEQTNMEASLMNTDNTDHSDEGGDDDQETRKILDIETLVEECFMQVEGE